MRRRRRLLMSRNGLTFTVIFLAESANYGEGVGNRSSCKDYRYRRWWRR